MTMQQRFHQTSEIIEGVRGFMERTRRADIRAHAVFDEKHMQFKVKIEARGEHRGYQSWQKGCYKSLVSAQRTVRTIVNHMRRKFAEEIKSGAVRIEAAEAQSDRGKHKMTSTKMGFVNAYRVTREYGGAEEGGWWYNNHEGLQSIPCEERHADEMAAYLKEKYKHIAHGNIYSVLGGVELLVEFESRPMASETTEKPIYE